MWRIVFALVVALPGAAVAQRGAVPGRDLLTFPIGLVAEAPALATQGATGLWNPATTLLDSAGLRRLTVAAMSTPTDVEVSSLVAAAAAAWRGSTFGFSVTHAYVANLLRTDSDPQTIGGALVYNTTVVSASVARRVLPHLTVGTALRFHTGTLDEAHGSAVALDAGVVADGLTRYDARIGASTFLASPWTRSREHTALLVAGDVRLLGDTVTRALRGGYSVQVADSYFREQFLFAEGRLGRWEARVGPVRTDIYGGSNTRWRMGLSVRHAGYLVGVSREESPSGLGPSYQFVLRSVLR
jgi:hypothetical protein